MKALLTAGLVLTFTVSTAIGQIGPADDSSAATRARMPSTLRYLNERIDEVDFEEASLDQVIEFLDGLTEMQIVVRWQRLEDYGIERDKQITLNVRNLRLSQVLYMIMSEAGGPDLRLAYRASGNLLIISTEEDLGKEMVVRVYDVSDLLVRAPRFTNAPQLDLAGAGGQGMGGTGGMGGGQNIFGGQGQSSQQEDEERDRDENADIDELIQLIVQTVEPDSWVDNGGLGTIQAFRNLLVVRNNFLVHQALGGYVEETD